MKPSTKIRRQLEDRLAVLERRVQKIDADRERRTNRLAQDSEERAIVLQNDEVLDGLDQEGREQIQAVLAALKQMDEGTYGTCTGCGGAIPPTRLEALPYATQCVQCAAGAEKTSRAGQRG